MNWEEIGYTPQTTFWHDFTIADAFVGLERTPIQDTYKRALEYAKTDYKIFTELVLVLNHKIWQWYETNLVIAKIYNELWMEAEDKFYELFEDNSEACHYYFEVTD